MSSRYEKKAEFEFHSSELSAPGTSDEALQVLHLASETVLRLATHTHDAVSRGDEAGAQAARMALEAQLALTTQLIDNLLFDDSAAPTTH